MKITGLHLLLTYKCTFECDHCFVWGSPYQSGVMTIADIRLILKQARELGTVESIYFEGGEPFLFYAGLHKGIREAVDSGFEVGIVSNGYWANSEEDAYEALLPLAGLVQDLTVSSDLFHYSDKLGKQVQNARTAADRLGISTGVISIARPEVDARSTTGQIPHGEGKVMYRGRAAAVLADKVPHFPWEQFDACTHEDLRDPGRVHIDPLGNLHICQGISIGNLFEKPLKEIFEAYDPETHPIAGVLLRDGPAGLVRQYGLPHEDAYADACHLCYEARRALRERFPGVLTPDQMYGV